MRYTEDRLTVAMSVCRVDIASNNIVAHQAVDDIGTFAISSGENKRVPQEIPFIHESVCTDTLLFTKIFERTIGIERVGANLELLSVAGCMDCL